MKTNKPFSIKKYLSISMLILGFLLFLIGACKKPKSNDDDNNIQPMYGVKTAVYRP